MRVRQVGLELPEEDLVFMGRDDVQEQRDPKEDKVNDGWVCETGNPAKTETTASSCFSYTNIELRIYVHINIQTYIWTYLCRDICKYCCLIPKSCPTLCDPIHCSPPGSSVHSIFQARILEWVVISFSRGSNLHLLHWQVASLPLSHQGSSYKECMLSSFSCVQLFATPWTVAHQAPLSMGFFRQESWSG